MKKFVIITLVALSVSGCKEEKPLCWVSIVVDESFNTLVYTTFEGENAEKECVEYFQKQFDSRKKLFERTIFISEANKERAMLRLEESKYFAITAYKSVFWQYFFGFFAIIILTILAMFVISFIKDYLVVKKTKALEIKYNDLKSMYDTEYIKT